MADVNGTTRFEPPPWEKEAFDALAARRAEEQVALEALRAHEKAAAGAVAKEPDPWDEVPDVKPAVEVDGGEAPGGVGAGAAAAANGPDDRMVEAMLVRLQSEERSDGRATAMVRWTASAITMALGTGMLITGLAMVNQGKGVTVAIIGSSVLSVFGLVFIGMAVWVWIATSRSRGRR